MGHRDGPVHFQSTDQTCRAPHPLQHETTSIIGRGPTINCQQCTRTCTAHTDSSILSRSFLSLVEVTLSDGFDKVSSSVKLGSVP